MKISSICQKIVVLGLPFLAIACGEKGGGGSSLWPVLARLQSSDLAGTKFLRALSAGTLGFQTLHAPLTTYSLINIDGMADSILIYTDEDGCGFNLWRAGNVAGAAGVFGRTPEAFDLTDPESWDPSDGGIRDTCNGGVAESGTLIFQYMDFHFDTNGASAGGVKVIRVVMSNTKLDFSGTETASEIVFHRGDMLIKDEGALDSTFEWADSSGVGTVISGTRPSNPIADNAVKNDPIPTEEDGPFWYEWSIPLVNADGSPYAGTMNREITKGVLDIDVSGITFINSGAAADNADILANTAINFIADHNAQYMKATPVFLKETEVGGTTDPDLSDDKGASTPAIF